GHRGIDADRAGAEAVALTLAGDIHSRPDRLAGLARGHALNVGGRQRGELDVQVDTVEERARQTAEVPSPLRGRAQAGIERGASATARIGGGDQLEPSGEIADAAGAGDRDATVLDRLTQRLEHVPVER